MKLSTDGSLTFKGKKHFPTKFTGEDSINCEECSLYDDCIDDETSIDTEECEEIIGRFNIFITEEEHKRFIDSMKPIASINHCKQNNVEYSEEYKRFIESTKPIAGVEPLQIK